MTVKARMLKLLEQRENELISGEAAAAELNCTRAAIWKAVKSLREEGYTIEAGPNKGYVLRGGSRLSEEGIRLYLDHPDVPVKIYRELDSTNRAAKEAAFSGEAGHGALILARRQKSGRGRRGYGAELGRCIQDSLKCVSEARAVYSVYNNTSDSKLAFV